MQVTLCFADILPSQLLQFPVDMPEGELSSGLHLALSMLRSAGSLPQFEQVEGVLFNNQKLSPGLQVRAGGLFDPIAKTYRVRAGDALLVRCNWDKDAVREYVEAVRRHYREAQEAHKKQKAAARFARLSANRLIYQLSKQEIWAAKQVVTAANLALKATHAFVKLVTDDSKPRHIAGSSFKTPLYRVSPAWDNEFEPPLEYHHTLGQLNRGVSDGLAHNLNGAKYFSHADCHRNAQTVMGSNSQGTEIDSERVVLYTKPDWKQLAPPTKVEAKNEAGLIDAHANRGVYAFFAHALPSFALVLSQHKDKASFTKEIGVLEEMGKAGFCSQTVKKGWTVYSSLLQMPGIAELMAAHLGINDCVTPVVGHSLSQVNNETERANAPKGVDLWNFHWAGVIMTDGSSYVTLENLSVENDEIRNTSWYFKIYDKKRPFHTDNLSDPHVGKTPITLGFFSDPNAARPVVKVQGSHGNFSCPKCQLPFPSAFKLGVHQRNTGHLNPNSD
jgi:hypothetical protein